MKKVIALLTVLILCIGLAGCGGEKDSSPIKSSEIDQLYTSPDDFKDRTFEFTGRVLQVEKDDDVFAIQAYYDMKNYDRNTVIYYSNDSFNADTDDFIHVTGTIDGEFSGENALGGTVTAPIVIADNVELVDYQTALAPTIKEIVPTDNNQTQKGYSVTVDKIELAESETRVYLTVKNEGSATFNLYSFDAKLIQDGKQLDAQDNYEAEYPQVSSDLKKGASTEGIICFPAIEEKNFSLSFSAMSENYNETIKDFKFDVTVE